MSIQDATDSSVAPRDQTPNRAAAGGIGGTRRHTPTGRTPFLDLRTGLLGAAGFLVAISWQVVLPVLPLHLSRIGYSDAQIGVLVSFLSLAMGIAELEVGRVAGMLGQRWALVGGLLANTVAMVWMAVARIWGTVGGALSSIGAARAMMWSPLQAAVADAASEETRGRTFGVFWFLTSLGFLAGPAIGGVVAAHYGDRAVFYLGAAISLATLPVVFAITTPARPTLRLTASAAGEVLRDRVVFRICLANHLHYAITGVWSTFLPLYAVTQGLTVLTVGEVFAIQGLAYALVQIPTGRLADRWGPERLVVPALVGRAVISLLVPVFHTVPVFLVAGAFYGLAGGFVPVTFATLVARRVSREHYTTAMGVYNSSGDLGFFVGPLLGGAAALLGILAPFYLCVPLGVAAIITGLRVVAAVEQPPQAV